ncbi:MAG: hypothetical protein WC551_08250 [Patescibacteria group bacterium]
MRLVLAALFAMVVVVSGCAMEVIDDTEFALTGTEIVEHSGSPALRVRFTATDAVDLRLLDPDGLQADSGYAEKGVTAVDLDMAGWYETAKPGKYTVIVEEPLGGEITSFDVDFDGCSGAISEVVAMWSSSAFLGYQLERISFKVTNSGDLPLPIYDGEMSIDGETQTLVISTETVLPGEEKTLTSSTYLYGISSGQHALSLTLEDADGKVVCSYTATLIP